MREHYWDFTAGTGSKRNWPCRPQGLLSSVSWGLSAAEQVLSGCDFARSPGTKLELLTANLVNYPLSPRAATQRPTKPSVIRCLAMATGALAVYGSLAFAANWEHGLSAALRAFLAQGILSAINTFAVTMLMERLIRLSIHRRTAFSIAAVGGSVWAGAMTALVHWGVHTPNFTATVVPIVVWGSSYCIFYSATLTRFTHGGFDLAVNHVDSRAPLPAEHPGWFRNRR